MAPQGIQLNSMKVVQSNSALSRVFLTIVLLVVPLLSAQEGFDTTAARTEFLELELHIAAATLPRSEIDNRVLKISAVRSRSLACIAEGDEHLTKLKRERVGFGFENLEQPELADTTRQELQALDTEVRGHQATVVDCQLLAKRAQELLESLTTYKGALLYVRLQENSRSAATIVASLLNDRSDLAHSAMTAVRDMAAKVMNKLATSYLWAGIGLVLLFAGCYLSFLQDARREVLRSTDGTSSFNRLSLSIQESLLHYAYLMLPLTGISVRWLVLPGDDSPQSKLLHAVCYLFTAYVWGSAMLRAMLRPANQQWLFVPIKPQNRESLARRLQILLFVISLAVSIQLALLHFSLPESIAGMLRLCAVVALTFNLIWLIWLVDGLDRLEGRGRWLRTFLVTILSTALLAELLGYLYFSEFLLRGFIGTLFSVFILWLLSEFTSEIFDGLDTGKRSWHRRVRQRLSIKDGEHMPGLVWFRLIAVVSVWLLAAMAFLAAWELSQVSLSYAKNIFEEGFSIGNLRVVPAKMLLGLVLFATIVLLSNTLKSRMKKQSSLLARLEPSARETALTLMGYTGFIIALLIGLSLAGFSFQNLAIVAGALSVGIGFGLQNIVNNFVSGIILLFERPIRRGDWVVVGGTEGFVKNIRVRSTEIETFDRSDVIVPNSEFISSQVTNWTLNDPNGRLKAPIGVAYGSDVESVRDILLGIANEHPATVKAGNFRQLPEPSVLFMGFGDSALDFELRFFIQDIRNWPIVLSDINFAIDREFRKARVEIPFPQRSVHLIPPTDSPDEAEQ
ncbi:MAG: potassium efflux system protein [Halioglobus sp.]|jgi:small-conductance mechanosensitive channel